jgi:hypothetical protein
MPRKLFFLLVVLAAIYPACTARADTVETIFDTHQSLSPKEEEWNFNVPPFSADQQVRLSLDARIDWPTLAGSNPWLQVSINGNILEREHLMNKRNVFKVQSGLEQTWIKNKQWRILYSPDFEAAVTNVDHSMAAPDDEPYHFVWDITGFVKPGVNKLILSNLKVLPEPTTMVFRNACVEVSKPIPNLNAVRIISAPTGPLPSFVATGKKKLPLTVRLDSGGRINLSMAGQDFTVSTRTSLPDGKWQETPTAFASGSPRSGKMLVKGQAKTVKWKAGLYDVKRKAEVRDDHVHISDTLTNRSKQLIGVIVEHHLKYPTLPTSLRVAGREAEPGVLTSQNIAENPSVFAEWPNMGLGMIAEDDVFRVHNKSFSNENGMGLADNQLGIAAGSSVTLEWNLYPVKTDTLSKGDYWSFVNAVRRNWGSNYTVPGPFAFPLPTRMAGLKSADWYKHWVQSWGFNILAGDIAIYPNYKYGFGSGTRLAVDWIAQQRDWIQKVKSTSPHVKILAYFHAQASGEPGSETKYSDSRMLNGKGEQLGIDFSLPTPPYKYFIPLYLPTRDNSYGKAVWDDVNTNLNMGVDGIYWDEMSYSLQPYVDEGPWDNHTVSIDPQTHAVLGKRSSVALVMQPLKLDIIRYLRKNGKSLIANSEPMTRTMLREKIVRFAETPNYGWLSKTHFGSPVGLANRDAEETIADTTRHIREMLGYGTLYYSDIVTQKVPPPWPFLSVMFPITPVELHEGMVLGEERIQTARSGYFGWPDGARADVYVIGSVGNRVSDPKVNEIVEQGRYSYEIRLASDEFAVLVRKPTP